VLVRANALEQSSQSGLCCGPGIEAGSLRRCGDERMMSDGCQVFGKDRPFSLGMTFGQHEEREIPPSQWGIFVGQHRAEPGHPKSLGHQRRHRTMMQPLELREPEGSYVSRRPIGVGRNQRHPVKQELEIGIGLMERDLPVWVVVLPGVVQRLPPNLIEVGTAPSGFDVGGSVC